jgi:hypothetical protein
MENNQSKFVLKLIELTKEGTIQWKYLDGNDTLCKQIGLEPKSIIPIPSLTFSTLFDKNSSFYVQVKTNYIVLYKTTQQENLIDSLRLLTVPSSFKDIQNISTETEEDILRLFSIIKSKFPSSEGIINDILSM